MARKPKSPADPHGSTPASGSDRNMLERAKIGTKQQNNMRAIRDSGSVMNRTDRITGIDQFGGAREHTVGKQYFGENPRDPKNYKKPTAKKK
jgi:hypothetical protein